MNDTVKALNSLYLMCCMELQNAEEFGTTDQVTEARQQLEVVELMKRVRTDESPELEKKISNHPQAAWAVQWIKDYKP